MSILGLDLSSKLPELAVGTKIDWCEHWKAMDKAFTTSRRSPLHHDNRCKLHGN